MEWLLIIVLLVVAFGPVFWLMPGPRERRIASLRQQAYREGMRVELRRLPKADPAAEERVTAGGRERNLTREVAAYLYPLPVTLRVLPAWRVLRAGDGSEAVAGWRFEIGRKPVDPHLDDALEAVAGVLHDLPDDVIAVECDARDVAGYFLESADTEAERVTDLAARLGKAAAALAELDQRLRAETEGRNI
ncbi:MAG: hypothetical protein ACODAC_09680 [Pseudomonadota bacterium]